SIFVQKALGAPSIRPFFVQGLLPQAPAGRSLNCDSCYLASAAKAPSLQCSVCRIYYFPSRRWARPQRLLRKGDGHGAKPFTEQQIIGIASGPVGPQRAFWGNG